MLALLCLAVTLAVGWSVRSNWALEGIAFFLIGAAITGWFVYTALVKVAVDATGVWVMAPLRTARKVEFRQLLSTSESGRLLSVLTLIYHPLWDQTPETRLLNLETVESLTLPALLGQEALFDLLETKRPQ